MSVVPDVLPTSLSAALAKLREVIAEATQGGWTLVVALGSRSGTYRGNYEIAEATDEEHEANATHIATFNPELTTPLLRVVEALVAYGHADCCCTVCVQRDEALAAFVVAAERKG